MRRSGLRLQTDIGWHIRDEGRSYGKFIRSRLEHKETYSGYRQGEVTVKWTPIDPRFISTEIDTDISYLAVRWFSYRDNRRALSDEHLLTECDAMEAVAWIRSQGSEPPDPEWNTDTTLSECEVWACFTTRQEPLNHKDSVGVLIWKEEFDQTREV